MVESYEEPEVTSKFLKCRNALFGTNDRRSGTTPRGEGIVDIGREIEKSSREFPAYAVRRPGLSRS
jgi:hypothetical protein